MRWLVLFEVDLQAYLQRFQWDMAKYPVKQSLKSIADEISKQMSQVESDLKNKANTYNSIKGNLQSLEKKATYVVYLLSFLGEVLYGSPGTISHRLLVMLPIPFLIYNTYFSRNI